MRTTEELVAENQALKKALAEALRERETAWNEQARLLNRITELEKSK